MESWKLDDVTSVTAEQSFPLWWILATVYAVIVAIVAVIRDGDEELKKDKDFELVMTILYVTAGIFFLLASKMTGGIGYCRKAYVTVYFKSPMYQPFFFLVLLLSLKCEGVAQGTADGMPNQSSLPKTQNFT